MSRHQIDINKKRAALLIAQKGINKKRTVLLIAQKGINVVTDSVNYLIWKTILSEIFILRVFIES